ncbi:endoribonuclease MazF [Thermus caliditerrae]|uniref:endoribonuclease MazF n=1 Tax=Thermus caliditerrae TaxID=1330700 RepID=UPI001F25F561|nr:endoribonuclease MazF [Thermus caliditerrae]
MSFVPDRGDLVWLNFDPQAGHEQGRRRPALTLSPKAYNARAGLALFCPVTSRVKGYPFEVPLPPGLPVAGVVLADQVRSLDYRARQAEPIARAPEEVIRAVLARVKLLLD